MGTFNLTITYPDNKETELLAALRWHFGQVEEIVDDVPTMRDLTAAEIKDKLEDLTMAGIRRIFIKHKRSLADVTLGLE